MIFALNKFVTPGNSEEYLDLAHAILSLQISIEQIATHSEVGLANVGPACSIITKFI